MQIDGVDRGILSCLQENGRMPLSEIARRVGMAPATVHERLARLRRGGVVQGFVVRLNPVLLGYSVTALVRLRLGLGDTVERAVADLRAIPEVDEIHVVTGDYDLVLKVRARDTAHLQKLLINRVQRVSGVVRSATEVCLSSPLERLGPPVEAERESAPKPG